MYNHHLVVLVWLSNNAVSAVHIDRVLCIIFKFVRVACILPGVIINQYILYSSDP